MEPMDLKVLHSANKEELLAFERRQLESAISDPMEREMRSWEARWRPEALDHYLSLGWSYGAYTDNELKGYLLGQPFLFYRGLTQTLWIEHIGFQDSTVAHQLLDAAHRWARDKHLQCVLIEPDEKVSAMVAGWKQTRKIDLIEIKSAKF